MRRLPGPAAWQGNLFLVERKDYFPIDIVLHDRSSPNE